MVTIPAVSPVTDAVVAALEDAGLTVGDGEKPAGAGWAGQPGQSAYAPYVVVYSMLGGTTEGPMDDPNADARSVVQLTSVGGSRRQAEWLGDRARAALMSGSLAVAGRKVALVLIDVLGGAVRDDDSDPAIYYVPERYRILSTPA